MNVVCGFVKISSWLPWETQTSRKIDAQHWPMCGLLSIRRGATAHPKTLVPPLMGRRWVRAKIIIFSRTHFRHLFQYIEIGTESSISGVEAYCWPVLFPDMGFTAFVIDNKAMSLVMDSQGRVGRLCHFIRSSQQWLSWEFKSVKEVMFDDMYFHAFAEIKFLPCVDKVIQDIRHILLFYALLSEFVGCCTLWHSHYIVHNWTLSCHELFVGAPSFQIL